MANNSVAECARCHFQLRHRRPNSRVRTLTFSLAALILYFPSNLHRGVFSFTAVVALTLLAALSFDPRLLWDRPAEKRRDE